MAGDGWDLGFSKAHKRLGQGVVALWQRAEPPGAGGTLAGGSMAIPAVMVLGLGFLPLAWAPGAEARGGHAAWNAAEVLGWF